MIPKDYVKREEFHLLTEAEAKAFIIFLSMEMERHFKDIEQIELDITELNRIHKIT